MEIVEKYLSLGMTSLRDKCLPVGKPNEGCLGHCGIVLPHSECGLSQELLKLARQSFNKYKLLLNHCLPHLSPNRFLFLKDLLDSCFRCLL